MAELLPKQLDLVLHFIGFDFEKLVLIFDSGILFPL